MRTFVGALLIAAASAQSSSNTTVTEDIKKAVSDVTNWLLGKTKDNLSTGSSKKEFELYAATDKFFGLSFDLSLDNTALGVNFV
jgi:hypothetical protein